MNLIDLSKFFLLLACVNTATADVDCANINIADTSVNEGDIAEFQITLDQATPSGFTMDYSITGDDSDLSLNTGTITFTGTVGEIVTIQVVTTPDEIVELDETFTVTLSNLLGSSDVTIADATATGTINDDDFANVIISDIALAEGNSNNTVFEFTFALDQEVDAPVTIRYDVVGDPTDIPEIQGAFSFTQSSGQELNISALVYGDTEIEADETFEIIITNINSRGRDVRIGDGKGVGTILNDDGASVSIEDIASVTERNSSQNTELNFEVSLDANSLSAFTVDWELEHLTTTIEDVPAASGQLSFAGTAGEVQNITINVTGDNLVEMDETFQIKLSNIQGIDHSIVGAHIARGLQTVTIIDQDKSFISLSSPTITEGDDGFQMMIFQVGLTKPSDQAVTFQLQTLLLESGDFTPRLDFFSIPAGSEEEQTFSVVVWGDEIVERDEQIQLVARQLNTNGRNVSLPDQNTGIGTIENDDRVTISLSELSPIVEGNSGEQKQLRAVVSIDKAIDQSFSLDFNTVESTASASDFTPRSGTLNFVGTAGEKQEVLIPIIGDDIVESNEGFLINFENLSLTNYDVFIPASSLVGNIQDDDTARITINDYIIQEGETSLPVTLVVGIDAEVAGGVTVDWTTSPGTATESDFEASQGTLTFSDQANDQQEITLNITGDDIVERAESFIVFLSNIQGPDGVTFAKQAGTITIENDDQATVIFENTPLPEGNSGTTDFPLQVRLSQPVDAPITFDFAITENDDLITTNGSVSFAADSLIPETPINLEIKGDDVVELNEAITISIIESETQGRDVTLPITAEVGIIENDDSATIDFGSITTVEGDSGEFDLSFTIALDHPVDVPVTALFSTSGGTATPEEDYRPRLEVPVILRQNQERVTISIIGDNLDEGDSETIGGILTTLNAQGRAVKFSSDEAMASATAIITDDDFTPVANTDGYYDTLPGKTLVVSPSNGLLSNDRDQDDGNGLLLRVTEITQAPTNGTVELGSQGNFTYQPNPGFEGIDRFQYEVTDGQNNAEGDVLILVSTVGNNINDGVISIKTLSNGATLIQARIPQSPDLNYFIERSNTLEKWTGIAIKSAPTILGNRFVFLDETTAGENPPTTQFYRLSIQSR